MRWVLGILLGTGIALLPTPASAADTVGAVDVADATWHLRTETGRTVTFTYGNPGDFPFVGDWDCDGVDTPGLYRPSDGYVYLRNRNTSGVAHVDFFFGNPGDVPVAGDFDGDGCDTVSVFRPAESRFYIVNRLGAGGRGLGPAEQSFGFGAPGDVPLAADLDADGVDDIVVHRPATGMVYARHKLWAGPPDAAYSYGDPGDLLVLGDWDGDGSATAGALRPAEWRFFLSNSTRPRSADAEFFFGGSDTLPVAGSFDLRERGQVVDWTPRELTIAAAGDILIHTSLMKAAATGQPAGTFDFRPMLAPIRGVLGEADLALCHLEVPLSPDNRDLSSYPQFNAPREVAEAIAYAGYHGCSVASNHSWDRRAAGVANTLAVLDDAGLGHAGTARTPQEAARPTIYRVGTADVAHLSYTWWLNGFQLPPDQDFMVNLIEPSAIAAEARRARDAGADLVLVSLHWGNEYQAAPSPYQRSMALTLTSIPEIDVIVGHHAHVVQPVALVRGKYVVFGMGNQASGQVGELRQDGVIILLDMAFEGDRWRVDGVRFEPTRFDLAGKRVLPAAPLVNSGEATGSLAATLRASYWRTAATLRSMGAPGVVPASPL